MSSAIELRKWLNRSDRDFVANLRFGIQVWRSMEFVLITKHQIVTEEFCRNLPHLQNCTDEETEVAWTTICEFLALKYSAGAIGSNVKEQLVQVLREEAQKSQEKPHGKMLEGLLLLLQNQAMQNYYKSSPEAFAGLIGTCFKYLNALVEKKADWFSGHDEVVVNLLASIRTFVKQAPQLDVFQKAFTADAFVPFTEMVVTLKQKEQDVSAEFFAIVQELYFPGSSAVALKKYLVNFNEDSEYFALFEAPVHALALWLEAILIAFKPDTDTQAMLHTFLFKRFFSVTQERFQSSTELLQCVSYYLCILKRHDAQMSTVIEKVKVSAFIGQHVEQLFNLHCESNLAEVLHMLCAALRLEPMMLEQHLVTMAVRCMVLKKDDNTTNIFSEFMCLVIDVFRRLSRAEKFMAQILLRLVERLAQTKLSSKMKRKSLAATGTPKKSKQLDGKEDGPDNNKINEQENSFFEYLRSEFTLKVSSDQQDASTPNEFDEISFAWPAGVHPNYIKFISGLVTKPSLTVWKTLIFSMTDCITLLKEGHSDNNTLFLVDFTAALLCQYFDGARLAEHAHTTWDIIRANIELTHSLLQEFGTAVLSQEHSVRTMNSFLKCCKHLANFELLCFYYWPDTSVAPESGRNIHPYLAPQQWTLIEQRITNFGRNECRANINRLYMQRIRAALLFKSDRPSAVEGLSGTPVLASTLTDRWQIEAILSGESSKVFANQLNVSEVSKLCEIVVESGVPLSLLSGVVKNKQFACILFVTIFKQLADRFGSKKSIFNSLDFDQLLGEDVDYAKLSKDLVTVIRQFVSDAPTVKKCSVAEITEDVARLRELPVEFVGIDRRNLLFLLNVALYLNVKASGEDALVADVLSYIKAFLHFGETPSLFDLLTVDDWFNIFGGSADVLPLYRDIFEKSVKTLNPQNKQMFEDLLKLVSSKKTVEGRERILDVGIILLDCLSKEKTCKEPLAKYRTAILGRIRRFFKSDSSTVDTADFVDRTITGFYIVVSSTLCIQDLSAEVDDGLKSIFLAYMQHAAIERNFGACVKLLGLALTHKKTLNITDDLFRSAVDRHWSVFLASLKSSEPNVDIVRNSEQFLKTILNDKSQEEFVDFLEAAEETGADIVDSFTTYKHKLYAHIAKCQLNKSKGTLFVEILKQVSQRILMSIRLRGPLLHHLDAVQKLLDCHKHVCVNIQTPITVELIDDILAFLGEINIKRFSADPDTPNPDQAAVALNNPFANPHTPAKLVSASSIVARSADFVALHSRMSDVCFAMIQHRPLIITDRVPQFTAILRDLLQSVAWYKSGRKKEAAALYNEEVSMLAELSHRIENIFKSLAKFGKDVKRVSPYMLIFTINLMISNEQPTTVFSKIKTHFESICYDLISVCDHRVEGFIMRNCNEASKQMYEQMVKEFNKYHKFTGKV